MPKKAAGIKTQNFCTPGGGEDNNCGAPNPPVAKDNYRLSNKDARIIKKMERAENKPSKTPEAKEARRNANIETAQGFRNLRQTTKQQKTAALQGALINKFPRAAATLATKGTSPGARIAGTIGLLGGLAIATSEAYDFFTGLGDDKSKKDHLKSAQFGPKSRYAGYVKPKK